MSTGDSSRPDVIAQSEKRVGTHRRGFSPSGRPLDYKGSQGWAGRIIRRTLYAAAIGAGAGMGVGIWRNQGLLKWSGLLGANFAIATSCFCGAQELVRELRAADAEDPINSLLGGLASGALLGRLHGGPARALPSALLFAFVGTGLQFSAVQLKEYRLQRLLASLAPEEVNLDNSHVKIISEEKASQAHAETSLNWPEWFPIKRLDEASARKRALQREQQIQRTIEGLHTGKLPVEDPRQ